MTQFDASTIQALGAQNIADLARVTPNVNIVQPGATQATFFVRGIGLSDFSSNAAGAVTIFQDGVALNAPAIQTGSLFDIEGVEIVRGPQGTGPYRNASAGAILRPIAASRAGTTPRQLRSTHRPLSTRTAARARSTAMFQDYEGALETPIVADLLSSRFAFRLREGDPYKRNGCGNKIPFDQRAVASIPTTAPNGVRSTRPRSAESATSTAPTGRSRAMGSPSLIPYGLDRRWWAISTTGRRAERCGSSRATATSTSC